MSAISRKTKRTSTSIVEYPAPDRLGNCLATVAWALVLFALALLAIGIVYFTFQLW